MAISVNHIGIILDGNRRYAKSRNIPALKGHEEGANKVESFLRWTKELGIRETTVYALSTENLNRDKTELAYLFKIFKHFFKKLKNSKEIHEDKIHIRFIGDLSLVPEDIKKLAEEIEEETKNYDNYRINFCFCYGGRLELVNAFNKLKDKPEKITEKDITNALWIKGEPEFIIRTGGKTRTSNFLPWQSIYSEWFFLDKMWPEIEKSDLIECIEKFQSTQRNFGK